MGWQPASEIDITVGKIANPLFTTPMVWDTDINPEGAAEHFKYKIGPAEFFATFGQFLYQDDNPSTSTLGLLGPGDTGHNGNTPFMLAWQGGLKYQLAKDVSFKAAGTLYNYIGHGTTTPSWQPRFPIPRHARILRRLRRRRLRHTGRRSQRLRQPGLNRRRILLQSNRRQQPPRPGISL